MYINTTSQEMMEKDVCDVLDINKNGLDDLFKTCYDKFQNNHSVFILDDQYDYFMGYVKKHLCKKIEHVLFIHLARRLNDDLDDNGYPLNEVLTKDTSLSRFLKKYGITFSYYHYIQMFLNGKKIDLKEKKDYAYYYLKNRFAYQYEDFGIKGIMFADHLQQYDLYEMLEEGPELFAYLYPFIDSDKMIEDFKENSTFYEFIYLVPIEEICFEDDLSNQEKQYHTIVKTLQHLYFCKYELKFNNEYDPLLLIQDNHVLSSQYLVEKKVLKSN